MEITKLLTPSIISVLFSTTDEEEVGTLYEFYQDVIFETQKEVANQYLREHGITEEEMEQYFGVDDPQNEKIFSLLQSEEMIKMYYETYNALVDSIYAQQTAKLNSDQVTELNEVIEQEKKLIELQKGQLGFQKEVSTILKGLIDSGKVTKEQVEEALGNAYDQTFGKGGQEALTTETLVGRTPITTPEVPTQVASEGIQEVQEMKTEENPSAETSVSNNATIQLAQEESEAPDQPNI